VSPDGLEQGLQAVSWAGAAAAGGQSADGYWVYEGIPLFLLYAACTLGAL